MSVLIKLINSVVTRGGYTKKVNGRPVKIVLPADKHEPLNTMPIYPIITAVGVPPNLFTNGGSNAFQITIPQGVSEIVHHITLKIDITLSAPAQLVPLVNFFHKIELKTPSSVLLRTWYNDSMMMSIGASTTNAMFLSLAKNLNIDTKDPTLYGMNAELPVGNYSFMLPLNSALWEDGLHWGAAKQDMILYLHPEATIVAAGAGVPICNNISLIIEGERTTDQHMAALEHHSKQAAQAVLFCEPTPCHQPNKPLQVGQNLIDLSNLSGRVAFLQLMIRPAGHNNVGNGHWKYLNIGDNQNASIDLLNASSSSVLGGTPIPSKYIRNELWMHNFNNSHAACKALYVIPHSTSLSNNFHGRFHGYREYIAGQKDQLQINISAPINEVQTLTPTTASLDAGRFQFCFRGELSESLMFNASTAQMSAAIEKMRVFQRNSITALFSKQLSAAGPTAVTFITPETSGLEGDLLTVVGNVALGAVPAGVNTTLTVGGRDGLVPGNYDVIVYGYVIKMCTFAGGELVVDNWNGV